MKTKIIRIPQITTHQRARMFQIMTSYYDHMLRAQFDADLDEKTHVILLLDHEQIIQGFSTLLQRKMSVRGREVLTLFSGDTVLDRAHWGNGALPTAFGHYLTRMKLQNPLTPTYWFLISKGYKTYLLMTNNFACHYPRFEKPTPPLFKEMLKNFYDERFGGLYDHEKDVIRFAGPSAAVKVAVSDIDHSLLAHPRIRFFAEKNPAWHEGQELACVARVSLWVPIRYFVKRLGKNLRRFKNAMLAERNFAKVGEGKLESPRSP